ncbi:hypothetical protein WDU94_004393 [Cyamophila willieti]
MKVQETVRSLSGATNNFVSESLILNNLKAFNLAGLGADSLKLVLGNMVQTNRLECFVPLTSLGSCCAPDCGGCGSCGGCGGGCCGCGRYYRVKIG